MNVTLILASLRVKSSYSDDFELPLEGPGDVPDTLQWYIRGDTAFRVKTYALSHDIHIYKIGPTSEDLVKLALQNNSKHYGDVIEAQVALEFESDPSAEVATRFVREESLPGFMEYVEHGFLYWTPDGEDYKTQTAPE